MIEIKRVALYARFSSDHQRTESIDAFVNKKLSHLANKKVSQL